MTNYKVVFRNDLDSKNLAWEPGCPLLVEAIQVARNTQTSVAFLQAKVRNISNEYVQSFEAEWKIIYEKEEAQIIEQSYLDADIASKQEREITPEELLFSDVESVEYRIISVRTDKRKWQTAKPLIKIASNKLGEFTSRQLNLRCELFTEKNIPNPKSAAQNSLQEIDDSWICVCGMPNVATDNCVRCAAPKKFLKKCESDEGLRELMAARKERLDKEAVEAKKEKRRQRRNTFFLILGVLIALGVAAFFFVMSGRETYTSEADMESALQGNWTREEEYDFIIDESLLTIDGDEATFISNSQYSSNNETKPQKIEWSPFFGTFSIDQKTYVVKKGGYKVQHDEDTYCKDEKVLADREIYASEQAMERDLQGTWRDGMYRSLRIEGNYGNIEDDGEIKETGTILWNPERGTFTFDGDTYIVEKVSEYRSKRRITDGIYTYGRFI